MPQVRFLRRGYAGAPIGEAPDWYTDLQRRTAGTLGGLIESPWTPPGTGREQEIAGTLSGLSAQPWTVPGDRYWREAAQSVFGEYMKDPWASGFFNQRQAAAQGTIAERQTAARRALAERQGIQDYRRLPEFVESQQRMIDLSTSRATSDALMQNLIAAEELRKWGATQTREYETEAAQRQENAERRRLQSLQQLASYDEMMRQTQAGAARERTQQMELALGYEPLVVGQEEWEPASINQWFGLAGQAAGGVLGRVLDKIWPPTGATGTGPVVVVVNPDGTVTKMPGTGGGASPSPQDKFAVNLFLTNGVDPNNLPAGWTVRENAGMLQIRNSDSSITLNLPKTPYLVGPIGPLEDVGSRVTYPGIEAGTGAGGAAATGTGYQGRPSTQGPPEDITQWGWQQDEAGNWTHPATGATGLWRPDGKFVNIEAKATYDPATGRATPLDMTAPPRPAWIDQGQFPVEFFTWDPYIGAWYGPYAGTHDALYGWTGLRYGWFNQEGARVEDDPTSYDEAGEGEFPSDPSIRRGGARSPFDDPYFRAPEKPFEYGVDYDIRYDLPRAPGETSYSRASLGGAAQRQVSSPGPLSPWLARANFYGALPNPVGTYNPFLPGGDWETRQNTMLVPFGDPRSPATPAYYNPEGTLQAGGNPYVFRDPYSGEVVRGYMPTETYDPATQQWSSLHAATFPATDPISEWLRQQLANLR